MHLKYGKMFAIVVGEKRGHIGRVFFVFFFLSLRCSVHQSVRPMIALRVMSVIMEARSFQNRF